MAAHEQADGGRHDGFEYVFKAMACKVPFDFMISLRPVIL
jgi:hypothetical protein